MSGFWKNRRQTGPDLQSYKHKGKLKLHVEKECCDGKNGGGTCDYRGTEMVCKY